MDIRKIKKLIELVEESGVAELEITEGEESVRINRYSAQPAPMQYAPQPQQAPQQAPAAPASQPAKKLAVMLFVRLWLELSMKHHRLMPSHLSL